MRQCKTPFAGNGRPFPRTATPQWRLCGALAGRAQKGSSALLHSLELATASPAVARLAANRFLAGCILRYLIEGVLVYLPVNQARCPNFEAVNSEAHFLAINSSLIRSFR